LAEPSHDPEANPWLTHRSKVIYDNPWIAVTEFQVTTPGGQPGIYGRVHFKNLAIAVVPVDEEGFTTLVGQFRYVPNVYSWEVPEGGCPEGESPLGAAQRELEEETGLRAQHWESLMPEVHLSNSVSDERALAFLATGLSQGTACPEDTEQLQLKRLPLREAVDMAKRGEITDALSVLALLRAEAKLNL
jgi:8-oxo-dGTP pyrophosphatase MutT (NUDIX family)